MLCTGEMVVFFLDKVKQKENLISEKGINCDYDYILCIDSFVPSTHPSYGKEAKLLFKMETTLIMKVLDVHIGGNAVWASHNKAAFQNMT